MAIYISYVPLLYLHLAMSLYFTISSEIQCLRTHETQVLLDQAADRVVGVFQY